MFPSISTPNPNSIQSPPLFSHFPSPFLDNHTDFTSSYNDTILPSNPSLPSSSSPPLNKTKKTRKDRHSKIFTAQGVRARRMRLPLEIAERFFHLQDMLGFNKASETIEWLLAKSKGPIKELTRKIPTGINGESSCGLFSESPDGRLKNKRDLARARARARTREKMRMRSLEKMAQLGPASSSNPNSSFDSNIGVDGNYSDLIFGCSSKDYNLLEYFLQNWDAENEMFGYYN